MTNIFRWRSGYSILLFLLLAFLVAFPLINNFKAILYNCLNVFDFGIYQQAINEIAAGKSLNPYLTVRNVFVFNEHFDPVIFLAAPFMIFSNYNPIALVVFEWLWYFLFIYLGIKFTGTRFWPFKIAIVIFCRAIILGVLFPIHPVTWAMVPLFLMVYFLGKERFRGVFICAFILCLFKETFAFGLFGLAFYYAFTKFWFRFYAMLALSTFFIIFELKLRSLWLGETIGYGNMFLQYMIDDFSGFMIKTFQDFDWDPFIKAFYPFIIPIFLICRLEILDSNRDWKRHFFVPCMFFLIPMFAMHVLINRFYFHHVGMFGAILVAVILCSSLPDYLYKKRMLTFVIVALFFGSSVSSYTKMSKLVFMDENDKCVISDYKLRSTDKILEEVKNIQDGELLYSTGGVINRILRPGLKVYHHLYSQKMPNYNWILLEKNGTGDTFPLNSNDVNRIYVDCAAYVSQVVQDDEFYYLAKGNFPTECVY